MKKTKAQIMKDIMVYAKDKEITPSLIKKYLMEELHLSKASAYRFLKKADNEYIIFTGKKYEKRDNLSYSNEDYKNLTKRVFDILHRMGKNSSNTITLQEIILISNEAGTTPRFLSCNLLGIGTKAFDKLINGEIKETKLSLGLGFNDAELSKKVKKIKNELIQNMLGRKFLLAEIQDLSIKTDIPVKIMLKKVFCLTRTQILNALKGKNVVFSNQREFIDYEYNDPPLPEDISDKEIYEDSKHIKYTEDSIFKNDDKKDSIYESDEFYNITAITQEDFIEQLNKKKEMLEIKEEYLIEKYDEMYLQLLNSYKALNISVERSSIYTPHINKILENYINQIKAIITRNPKYYDFYPPRLKLDDFEKISEDFNFDKKFLAYKMFRRLHYERGKERAKNPYFEISDRKLPEASNFYMLFQNEIDKGVIKIAKKTIRMNTNPSIANVEDLCQILKMTTIISGNAILFYGRKVQSKEEYLAMLFAYLKAVCVNEYKRMQTTITSLNQPIGNDSTAELGDFIASANTEEFLTETETETESDILNKVFSKAGDSLDEQIMRDMIRCLKETENREKALRMLAKEMELSPKDMQEKLDKIYERFK